MEEYKALARRKYEHYRQSDIDKSLTLYPAFSDFQVIVEKQIAEGNEVASYWVMRGKHTGEYLGIPPSGREVMLSGMAIDRIEEGKIKQICSVMDFEEFLQRLKSFQ